MTTTICLGALSLGYPEGEGGGHMWVYLNRALGFKQQGCEVIWLEAAPTGLDRHEFHERLQTLEHRLASFGLDRSITVASWGPSALEVPTRFSALDAAFEADLLVNLWYRMPEQLLRSFRRSALLDIDPGLLQGWMARWNNLVAQHDVYVTTGETVGKDNARFTDGGHDWHFIPPCVSLAHWPVHAAGDHSPYTTVSHWQMGEYEYDGDEIYSNDKRTGFLPFQDLPNRTDARLELALYLSEADEPESSEWRQRGWSIIDSRAVAADPFRYQQYIQSSRGEFSAVKPSCIRLQNAWISDRTLCYLASGKPAVVENTGPSRLLPEADGLFRVRDVSEAARALDYIEANYDEQCERARALAETQFGAKRAAARLLEIALP
jgi:hypothetical protein